VKIAAIDCGTNSFHLLIASVGADGSVEPLERAKEMVRLGDSAFRGSIAPEAFTVCTETIRRFRGIAERAGCDAIIAVATSAVREAENGGDFVRVIRDETGIELTVIRGDEEAHLIYLGARSSLMLGGKRALIVDIGGGSVELIVGDAHKAYYSTSLKLGVLRLLESWKPSDPITPDQRARLAEQLHRALEGPTAAIRRIGYELFAMTSGTARQIADLVAAANPSRPEEKPRKVAFSDLYALEDKLCALPSATRALVPGLDPKRVDSIVPGVILVRSLLEVLHADEYMLCDSALREGLVVDYATRNRPGIQLIDEFPDLRRRSVVRLARRCQVNWPHAEHVARLALDLFRGTRPLHNLPNADGELLEFASLLHDIGFHVASAKHHKHAAYLIENAELQGFTAEEIQVLAQVARYHRKSTPKESHEGYSKLSVKDRQRVKVLASLLRVADGLDRGYAQLVRGVRCVVNERSVEIVLSMSPEANTEPELEIYSARRKRDLFEEALGRKLRLVVSRPEPAPGPEPKPEPKPEINPDDDADDDRAEGREEGSRPA
jgi:exopolyphosphatase/guanosine-5'-triphosphate,3'-diphosphate pyrophosphatase